MVGGGERWKDFQGRILFSLETIKGEKMMANLDSVGVFVFIFVMEEGIANLESKE